MTGRETIIFLHIPKAAGTTLNYLLEKQFSPEQTYGTSMTWHHPDGSMSGFQALSVEEKERLAMVNGHMGFGLHRELPRPARYITVLREPIARTLSHYHFEGQFEGGLLYPIIQSGRMDLQEYIKYYNHYECDNLQTRMIAGNWDKRGYGACTAEMLETAKRNLREQFAVVGVVERFDEFYILLCRTFGWRPAFTRRHNVGNAAGREAELTAKEKQMLLEHNRFDLELYRYVLALFEEQLQRQGIAYPIELAGYRVSRRVWHKLEDLYWEGRKYSVRVFLRERLGMLTQRL